MRGAWRALLYAMLAFGVHLAMVWAFSGITRRHDARRMDARWLVGAAAMDVMVAGDSHARYAVEGPVLGSAINVAVPGEHYQKSLYRVPWLLDHGRREVGAVLLPFDAVSFADFKADSFGPESVWDRYVDWFELGRMRDERWPFVGKWAKARLLPYLGEGETVLQWLTRSRHFRGQNQRGRIGVAAFEGGVSVARRHLGDAEAHDADMEGAFRRLVRLIRQRGPRVVLVSYPVSLEYTREMLRLGADRAQRERIFGELGNPGKIDWLDYEALYHARSDYFGDGDHLNPDGKRVFSFRLAEDLRRIGALTGTEGGAAPADVPSQGLAPGPQPAEAAR